MNNNASSSETQNLFPPSSSSPNPMASPNSNGLRQMPRSPIPPHHQYSHLNPSPTTFVQAHTSTFKQVVQMLTGSVDTAKQASSPKPQDSPNSNHNFTIPLIRSIPSKKSQNQQQQQQSFKLYERRNNSFKHTTLMINPAGRAAFSFNTNLISSTSPSSAEILSPSVLDFPKLTLLSPVTPLNHDVFRNNNNNNNTSGSSPCASSVAICSSSSASEEEELAIAEKGFYLHPSPLSTPRESEPQLLPLFPLTSPTTTREAESPPAP